MSSAGKWQYPPTAEPMAYGDDTTYALGAEFLSGLSVEDWGCGMGWFKKFHQGKYLGVDGSRSRHADIVCDLISRKTTTEGIFLRHVLEHNPDWRQILDNAIASFQKRLVVVVFTPLEDKDRVLTHGRQPIPDIALSKPDLLAKLRAPGLTVTEKEVSSASCYKKETIFFVERTMPYHDLSGRPWVVSAEWMSALSGGELNMTTVSEEPIASELPKLASYRLEHPLLETWGKPFNPSIVEYNGQVLVNVRCAGKAHPQTKNFLGHLIDRRFEGARELVDHSKIGALSFGFEDLRLFVVGGKLCAMAATSTQASVGSPHCRQTLLVLSDDGGAIDKAYVQESVRHEKNWMPCVTDKGLRLVYSVNPLQVLGVSEGVVTPAVATLHTDPAKVKSTIRGGSQLAPYKDGWIAVVHQINVAPGKPGAYVHRFAVFDEELTSVKLSPLFYFQSLGGIEFCSGLMRKDGKFYMSFGVKDVEAWIAEVDEAVVDALVSQSVQIATGAGGAKAGGLPSGATGGPSAFDPDRPVATITRPVVVQTPKWHMLTHEANPPPPEGLPAESRTRLHVEGDQGFQHNPSAFLYRGELWAIVRSMHGEQSRNFLGKIVNGEFVNPRQIEPNPFAERISGASYLEDLRGFEWQGGIWALGAAHSGGNPPASISQAFLSIADDGELKECHLQASTRHEKNWMPLLRDGKLQVVYTSQPLAVLDVHAGNRRVSVADVPQAMGHIRGSTQAVPFADGYLAVVHEVYKPKVSGGGYINGLGFFEPGNHPIGPFYVHRFAWMDKDAKSIRFGKPFVFHGSGIEFAAGLAVVDGKLLVSYGIENREAWIATVDPLQAKAFLPIDRKWSDKDNRLVVCHSDRDRCGVREYGMALDAHLANEVHLAQSTFTNFGIAGSLDEGDAVLVHYEGGLVPHGFYDAVAYLSRRGVRIVFCCHNFGADVFNAWRSIVDTFVVHRDYGISDKQIVEIPLGCPTYNPGDRTALRAKFGMPDDKIVVSTLGFLAPWKRLPEITDQVLRQAASFPEIFVMAQTPIPFAGDPGGQAPLMQRIFQDRWNGKLSMDFLSSADLLDFAYASDVGFVFHPINTGSVSAATKPFMAARRPVVVTASSHASDVRGGCVRVDSFDPAVFAKAVIETALSEGTRLTLESAAQAEYDRMNMGVTAKAYADLLRAGPRR